MRKSLLAVCALTLVPQIAVASNMSDSYIGTPDRQPSPTLKADAGRQFRPVVVDEEKAANAPHATANRAEPVTKVGWFSRFCDGAVSLWNKLTSCFRRGQ